MEGLRSRDGAAAPPFTKAPYTWNMTLSGITNNYTSVGLTLDVTTSGSAATWICPLYSIIREGTTKNVNGYLNAAEFELAVGGTYAPSDMYVLSLNSTITNTQLVNCSHKAYIGINDYGTDNGAALGGTSMPALFHFAQQTIGADNDATSLLAANTIAISTHTIRFLIGNVPYYIMCANVTHN